MHLNSFSPEERRIFRRLNSPARIQRYFESLDRPAKKSPQTCRSARRVLRENMANCMEGAMMAAAALRMAGHRPLLMDLEAVRDDDHVVALFRHRGCWGAVSRSEYPGLGYREPVYRTLRELALSYFEHYFNKRGEKTLRNYSRPVDLRRFDPIHWMTSEEDVWAVPEYLCVISHTSLLASNLGWRLSRVSESAMAEAQRYQALPPTIRLPNQSAAPDQALDQDLRIRVAK
jgi:hypothetical protein